MDGAVADMKAENTGGGERGQPRDATRGARNQADAARRVEDRTLTIDGASIAIGLYRSRGRGKTGVLVYLGGDDAELAGLASEAHCLVVSFQTGAGHTIDDGRRVLDWVRANARKLGADASRLALGATGVDAGDAIAIAQTQTAGSLTLLLLRSPRLDLATVEPALLPSTFVQTGENDANPIFDFATAVLAADVELELHMASPAINRSQTPNGAKAPDVALAVGALKRALKLAAKRMSVIPLVVTVLGSFFAFAVSTYLGADLPAALGQAAMALVVPLTLQALWARWRGRG
ncbi:alpha/beta hydrolase [Terricaulis silvestris]|nr:hypothetical protein [Terricaulis silvestris]